MCDFTKGSITSGSSILAKVLNINGRRKYGNMFDSCPLSVNIDLMFYEKNIYSLFA